MKRRLMVLLFIAAGAGALCAGPLCAEPEGSVDLGISGVVQSMPHCSSIGYLAEYERLLNSKFTVLGRASQVDYHFNDGSHIEDGRPRGLDLGARFYSRGNMQGFFIGGAVGYWMSHWTFTKDRGEATELHGKGTSESVRANVDIGGRFPIHNSSVSIMPALNFGKFFSSTSCEYTSPASRVGTSCNQKTEVEYYLFLAVTAGIAF
jgi:hypothetical protein